MSLDQRKYERAHTDVLRDIRPMYVRIGEWLANPGNAFAIFICSALAIHFSDFAMKIADVITICALFYFLWLITRDRTLVFKMPMGSKWTDKNNEGPGRSGKGEGIMYLGNVKDTNEEVWFTNSDARTHILYLGTTGAGKTEGLKSMVTNALTWSSGFVYIDGKADTDLWSSLSSMVRRFGRDDDLLVLNYMTGNSDVKAPSNTMNPFSSGSASYLTNMLVELMPEAEGDNAMWKERAVSLIASLMPAMTWKRDHQDIPMSVSTIRNALNLNEVIKISRDEILPNQIREGVKGYLDTLPGYVDEAFDDDGQQKPMGPDSPPVDTSTCFQQHGYLSMQFTRSLQSLGDEYGYIFDTQAADVDMVDVVLNRRILVVLIPALEKSGDEIANLGKIVAATIKGMMGSTLGATLEGESSTVIENKPTFSATPFMTVFDEVGYYTAKGMAVMAAQARSLGFCLVFSGQDIPAMKKRVKEEANSILANCNIKIFGKLEDPTETKDFFDKTVGQALVMESGGFQQAGSSSSASYHDTKQASLQIRPRASYDGLRGFKEGEAVVTFGEAVVDTSIFYSNPGHAKAMRVTRFIALPPPDENLIKSAPAITKLRDLMVHKTWTAEKADVAVETPEEIAAMAKTFRDGRKKKMNVLESGMAAVVAIHALNNEVVIDEGTASSSTTSSGGGDNKAPAAPQKPPLTAQKPGAIDKPVSPLKPPPTTAATPEQKTTDAAPAEKADNSNPMSFFSTKKNEEAPAAPAEPEQKPEPPQEKAQPSSTTAEPESATPPPAPTPPQEEKPQQQPPKNWQDLVKETSEEDGEENSKDIPEANLDDDSKKELRDAGKNAMDMLLGKKPKDSEDAPKDPPKETKDNKDDDKNS
jgi:intracellular multiplication protein IcmO